MFAKRIQSLNATNYLSHNKSLFFISDKIIRENRERALNRLIRFMLPQGCKFKKLHLFNCEKRFSKFAHHTQQHRHCPYLRFSPIFPDQIFPTSHEEGKWDCGQYKRGPPPLVLRCIVKFRIFDCRNKSKERKTSPTDHVCSDWKSPDWIVRRIRMYERKLGKCAGSSFNTKRDRAGFVVSVWNIRNDDYQMNFLMFKRLGKSNRAEIQLQKQ